jgi:hypothetical protein
MVVSINDEEIVECSLRFHITRSHTYVTHLLIQKVIFVLTVLTVLIEQSGLITFPMDHNCTDKALEKQKTKKQFETFEIIYIMFLLLIDA